MFQKNDIVRVKPHVGKSGLNKEWTDQHGWVWVVEGDDGYGDWAVRSLATGATRCGKRKSRIWFTSDEIELISREGGA